jgi:hypothetical protein
VRQAHGWTLERRGRREREARMQGERCIFYARALNKLAMKKRWGNNKAAGRRWQFVWFSGDGYPAGLRAHGRGEFYARALNFVPSRQWTKRGQ